MASDRTRRVSRVIVKPRLRWMSGRQRVHSAVRRSDFRTGRGVAGSSIVKAPGQGRLSHPLSTTGDMLLQSRCAGCDRPGVALCRTCRFALAGPSPRATLGWAEGGVIAALPFTGRVPRRHPRVQVPQPTPARRSPRRSARQPPGRRRASTRPRRRRRDLGADELCSPTPARVSIRPSWSPARSPVNWGYRPAGCSSGRPAPDRRPVSAATGASPGRRSWLVPTCAIGGCSSSTTS